MAALRHRMIHAGLQALRMTRLHRLAAPLTRGRGAILTLHHVRPWQREPFAPNRGLEITPAFLDAALTHVKAAGYRIVALDEVPALLRAPDRGQPFVALTFDDGYRDLREEALPVLEAHDAPFTAFVTTGFLDRTARLWWVDLETLIRAKDEFDIEIAGRRRRFGLRSVGAKSAAFAAIAEIILRHDDGRMLDAVLDLSRQARLSGHATVDRLCMTWAELSALATHPLATIGCHTATHPRLAGLDAVEAADEVEASRDMLEKRLGRPIRHLCYPYGSRHAAGPREFRMAEALGFDTAVTTRPGVLTAAHGHHLLALPRISLNGLWQSRATLEILLSGVGFALWNRGRFLDVE